MDGILTHYYFFKNSLKLIPSDIKKNLTFNNELLFNLTTFNVAPKYTYLYNPFKRNKYHLYDDIYSDKFNDYFTSVLVIMAKKNDYKKLLLVYSMVSYYVFNQELIKYIKAIKGENANIDLMLNNFDYYYLLKEENRDLSKTKITTLFKDLDYKNYYDELIHKLLVRHFNFFGSYAFYTKGYKRFKFFYSITEKSGFLRFLTNKKKDISKYQKKLDEDIFNNQKKEYILDDKFQKYSFDEFVNITLDKINVYYDAINSYLFDNNEKKIRDILNIPKERKI